MKTEWTNLSTMSATPEIPTEEDLEKAEEIIKTQIEESTSTFYRDLVADGVEKFREMIGLDILVKGYPKNCGITVTAGDIATTTDVDVINHPSHYTSGKIEVIDFIEDQQLDYRLGNVVKYVSRAGKKDPTKTEQDLRKAQWYLNRYLEKEFEQTSDNNSNL